MLKLTEDILIYIFSFLHPPSIVLLRQTCKRLYTLSYQRIVWTNACTTHILSNTFPFPSDRPLADLALDVLEQYTLKAWHLALKWRRFPVVPPAPHVIRSLCEDITSVSDVRFVPCSGRTLVATISKSVWSGLTVWELDGDANVKRCEWFPRGAIFSGFAVNEKEGEGIMAVSAWKDGEHIVHILSLDTKTYTLHSIASLNTILRPITLTGHVLALNDDVSKTLIWDWRQSTHVTLQSSPWSDENQGGMQSLFQKDRCIQIIFAYQSILVVSARSINLFPFPAFSTGSIASSSEIPTYSLAEGPQRVYVPLARHSFGWVDGVAVSVSTVSAHEHFKGQEHVALSILLRPESDDPWYPAEKHKLEMYMLQPNMAFNPILNDDTVDCLSSTMEVTSSSPSSASHSSDWPAPPKVQLPYIFPPTLTHTIPTRYGILRCTSLALGKCGTGVWIEPRDPRTTGGLVVDRDINYQGLDVGGGSKTRGKRERVMCAVFPGPLSGSEDGALDSDRFSRHARKKPSADRIREEFEGPGLSEPQPIQGLELDLSSAVNDDTVDWAAFDYDESRGRLVLASSFGKVLVLEL